MQAFHFKCCLNMPQEETGSPVWLQQPPAQCNPPGAFFNPITARIKSEKVFLSHSYVFLANPNTTACLALWNVSKQNKKILTEILSHILWYFLGCTNLGAFVSSALCLKFSFHNHPCSELLPAGRLPASRGQRRLEVRQAQTQAEGSWRSLPALWNNPWARLSQTKCDWIVVCKLRVWSSEAGMTQPLGLAPL